MALTDKELQEFIDSLSLEELEQLQTQLKAKESSESSSDSPRVQPKAGKSKISCCPYCKSTHYKKHGCTSSGMQRYICKDCRKTFSENHGDSLRYTHLSSEQWKTVIRGIVYDHSLPMIAVDAHISVSTAWLCRIKVNQAIATMYGYSDLFKGLAEADEYYYRASFKGKRSPEFFIYIQCKNHKVPLEKTAVAEVYAGMHVRNATADNCIPVVFSTSDASEETRLYAKQLGVELILSHEMSMIIQAKKTGKVPYDNYGILMRTILFYHTHDEVWFDALPDNKSNLAMVSMAEQYMDSAKSEFDKAEVYLNNAAALEQKALENRKKALDIQKVAVYRSLCACENLRPHRDRKKKDSAEDG